MPVGTQDAVAMAWTALAPDASHDTAAHAKHSEALWSVLSTLNEQMDSVGQQPKRSCPMAMAASMATMGEWFLGLP